MGTKIILVSEWYFSVMEHIYFISLVKIDLPRVFMKLKVVSREKF